MMKYLSLILSLSLCLFFTSENRGQDYTTTKQNTMAKNHSGNQHTDHPISEQLTISNLTIVKQLQTNSMEVFYGLIGVGLFLGICIRYRSYILQRRSDKLKLEVYRRTQIIEKQKRELEASNRYKDKYLMLIGHDLRAPLLSLNGMSRKLRYLIEEERFEDLQKLSISIDRSSTNMIKLVDNMFSWNLMQNNQYRIYRERLDILNLIGEVVELYRGNADSRNIKIHIEHLGATKAWVDRSAFLTVLRNLLDNAIKFAKPGGEILIRCRQEEKHLELKIENYGEPISDKQITCLYNNKRAKLSNGKGSGLGLLICKELIEMSEGQFCIYNDSSQKTIAKIQLQQVEA